MLDQFTRLQELKGMMGQQQLQQQQIQENQLNLNERQNMVKLAPQYVQKDDSGNVTGYDQEGYFNALQGAGVRPSAIYDLKSKYAGMVEKTAQAGTAQLELQNKKNDDAYQILEGVRSVAKQPNVDPNALQTTYQQALPQLQRLGVDTSKYPQQYPGDSGLTQFEAGLGVHKQILADAKTIAETNEASGKAAAENAQAALNQLKVKGANLSPQDVHSLVSSVVPPTWSDPTLAGRTEALMNAAIRQGDLEGVQSALKSASAEMGAVAKETNPAVQAGKVAVATAEGRARQLVEGMIKPVYAVQPNGTKTLMSATDALQAGYRTMLPVTAKEVGEDTQLNNRLADVENKVGRFQQSFQNDLSLADKNGIAQLIGEDKFKAGLWGTTIPVDFLNKANEAYLHGQISKAAQDRLIGFYNANESLIGYNRVLSGSARSNEKQLELQQRTLPSPIDNPDYGNNALNQFKENLDYAGQGLPTLPGVKSHIDVRNEFATGTAGAPGQAQRPGRPAPNASVGAPRILKFNPQTGKLE